METIECLCLPDCRYRNMDQWDDGTVGYFLRFKTDHDYPSCTYIDRAGYLSKFNCETKSAERILCEEYGRHKEARSSGGGASGGHGQSTRLSARVPHVVCPSGHWTHTLLACDPLTDCWPRGAFRQSSGSDGVENTTSSCGSVLSTLFTCRNGAEHVPYSLVCDHSQDCLDASDEDFCLFPSCSGSEQFKCTNRQV